jgi:hypothetical protein
MASDVEKAFHSAMLDIYKTAKAEAGYNATRFLSMVSEQGGLQTARTLLHATTVSEGYTALWDRDRLDLTVEALVIEPRWVTLFSTEERAMAIARLKEYGYSRPFPAS